MSDVAIRGLRKSYGGVEIVHAIDLDVRNGEFLVVLGPSGCGKSTLLRLIAGLEEISGGEIAIGGRVVNRLEPRERGCAMVFQNYALYPHMSVADNIGYALKVAGVRKRERMSASPEWPRYWSSRVCSTASPRRSRAGSASVSPWGGRSSASPASFCSTNRSPIWMPSSASRCESKSDACISG
jgi:sn-glycerol 3-phosphate transport system ATP-binding protein